MSRRRRGAKTALPTPVDVDGAETLRAPEVAQRMVRALTYLMEISSEAGLGEVTAKLALARGELLSVLAEGLLDEEPDTPAGGARRPH